MRGSRRLITIGAAVSGMALLAGCGDDGAEAGTIDIADFEFAVSGPVSAGATVSVANADTAPHTVTADDGSFDVPLQPEESGSFTAPAEAGTYAFICSIHPAMTGELVVE